MTIQLAKDQAALEFGYHTFEQASNETNYSQEIRINNTAMEIFAEAKAKEAFEAARERIDHPDWDYVYDEYEDWKKYYKQANG